jgi:hypothetical protein
MYIPGEPENAPRSVEDLTPLILYELTEGVVNRAPLADGIFILYNASKKAIHVGFGTLRNELWCAASRHKDGAVKWFCIDTLNSSTQRMKERVNWLRRHYGLADRQ